MKKNLNKFGSLAILILGVVAALLLMLQAFKLGSGDDLVEGTKIIFGGAKDDSLIQYDFVFNILLFVGLLAPIAAGVVGLVMKNRNGYGLSLVLFVVSIILLVVTKETGYKVSIGSASQTVKVAISLAPLGWLSVVLSGLGAVTSVGMLLQD